VPHHLFAQRLHSNATLILRYASELQSSNALNVQIAPPAGLIPTVAGAGLAFTFSVQVVRTRLFLPVG
jgi:hypothetical protein